MANSIKETGVLELQKFKMRVARQRAFGRISAVDSVYLTDTVNEMLSHIVRMEEIDNKTKNKKGPFE